ncbi:MAG: DUF3347 domain-containing protein [Tunicatimonas sp.]
MITYKIFILSLALLGLAACSGNPEQQEATETNEATTTATNRTEKAAVAEQKTTGDVVSGYLALKDALVASNAKNAQDEAIELLQTVDAIKMPDVQQRVKEMAAATDLAVQRTYFDSLSVALYDHIKAQSPANQTLYKQYCPMAFNNRGAFWLSANREIENPYFGDEMLKCGRVEEEITF